MTDYTFYFSPSDRKEDEDPISIEIEGMTDIYQLVHAVIDIGKEIFALFYDRDNANNRWRKVAYFDYQAKKITRTNYTYPKPLPQPDPLNWRGFTFAYAVDPISPNPCYNNYKYNQESNLTINPRKPEEVCLYESNFDQAIDGTPLKEKVFDPAKPVTKAEVKVTHCKIESGNCNLTDSVQTRNVQIEPLYVAPPSGINPEDVPLELLSLIPVGPICTVEKEDNATTEKSTRQIWTGGWLKFGAVKLLEIPKTDPFQYSVTLRKSVGIITINHGQKISEGKKKWCKKTMFAVSDNPELKKVETKQKSFLTDEEVTPAKERDDWQDWMYEWEVKDPKSKDACANLYTEKDKYKEVNLKLDKDIAIAVDLEQKVEDVELKQYILSASSSETFNADVEVRNMTREAGECQIPEAANLEVEAKIYGFGFTAQQVKSAQVLAASPDYRKA